MADTNQHPKSSNPRYKKSTKGALIKGMSKRLPAEILEATAFEEGLKKIMKGYSGIYALYKRNQLYYVGLTTNLHGRLNGHRKDRHSHKWDSFVIFRVRRVDFLKDLETLLLQVAEPPGNRSRGHVPKDANLNHVLRKVQQEEERKFRRIKKALR